MQHQREPMHSSFFTIESKDNQVVIRLAGHWKITEAASILEDFKSHQKTAIKNASVEGSGVKGFDSTGAYLLLSFLSSLELPLKNVNLEGFPQGYIDIIRLVDENFQKLSIPKKPKKRHFVEKVGFETTEVINWSKEFLSFIGEAAIDALRVLKKPSQLRVNEIIVQLEHVFLNAIPVVLLVNFLIGIVIAYLFGIQIERYGASIFVVDGSALAVCRELSPILVAIIVAGRSGSAFTAQLGTMRLNEEIEAMITMGLNPIRVLVLPRVIALIIAMPLLVFLGDIAGIWGSSVICEFRLGITTHTFIDRLKAVLPLKSVFVGLVKAPVFAIVIALIGCKLGLSVEKNARSVGVNTTATVVRSIVAVILINAAFAILFVELGI